MLRPRTASRPIGLQIDVSSFEFDDLLACVPRRMFAASALPLAADVLFESESVKSRSKAAITAGACPRGTRLGSRTCGFSLVI